MEPGAWESKTGPGFPARAGSTDVKLRVWPKPKPKKYLLTGNGACTRVVRRRFGLGECLACLTCPLSPLFLGNQALKEKGTNGPPV